MYGPQSWCGRFVEETCLLPLPGIETIFQFFALLLYNNNNNNNNNNKLGEKGTTNVVFERLAPLLHM